MTTVPVNDPGAIAVALRIMLAMHLPAA